MNPKTLGSIGVLVIAIAVFAWVVYAGQKAQVPTGETISNTQTPVPDETNTDPQIGAQPQDKPVASETALSASAPLRANTWIWVKTVSADGSVVTPKTQGVFLLDFSNGGRVSGRTDCNGFGGEYSVDANGVISFGPFMSTLMYCEGSQESQYSQAVASAERYTISRAGELVLMMQDGGKVYFVK